MSCLDFAWNRVSDDFFAYDPMWIVMVPGKVINSEPGIESQMLSMMALDKSSFSIPNEHITAFTKMVCSLDVTLYCPKQYMQTDFGQPPVDLYS